MTKNLDKLVTYGKVNALISHMSLWPRTHVRSRNKLKAKYFFLQKTYRRQTWQGTDVWWNKAHNEVAWVSDHHMITSDHMSNWKTCYVLFYRAYDHQIWQSGSFGDWKPPMESHLSFVTQSCKAMSKI